MGLRIGVLMDPISSINTKKDTTLGLLRAATDAGHELIYLEQQDLFIKAGETFANLRPLEVFESDDDWYALSESYTASLSSLDLSLIHI